MARRRPVGRARYLLIARVYYHTGYAGSGFADRIGAGGDGELERIRQHAGQPWPYSSAAAAGWACRSQP